MSNYQGIWHNLKEMLISESIDPCEFCTPKIKCQCSVCDPAKEFNEELVLNVMKKLESKIPEQKKYRRMRDKWRIVNTNEHTTRN